MAYVVTGACIDEQTFIPECERVCPESALKRTAYIRLIDPDACVDCGDCASACPVGAIFAETALPRSEADWLLVNRSWRDYVTDGR